MERRIDYEATARKYGLRLQSWSEFRAAHRQSHPLTLRAMRIHGELVRSGHGIDGEFVLYEPAEDAEDLGGFMLIGDDRTGLAREWLEHHTDDLEPVYDGPARTRNLGSVRRALEF